MVGEDVREEEKGTVGVRQLGWPETGDDPEPRGGSPPSPSGAQDLHTRRRCRSPTPLGPLGTQACWDSAPGRDGETRSLSGCQCWRTEMIRAKWNFTVE